MKEGVDDPIAVKVSRAAKLMGREDGIFYCGPLGAGRFAKLASNSLFGVHSLAVCEAVNFKIRSEVNKKVVLDVISKEHRPELYVGSCVPCEGDCAPRRLKR